MQAYFQGVLTILEMFFDGSDAKWHMMLCGGLPKLAVPVPVCHFKRQKNTMKKMDVQLTVDAELYLGQWNGKISWILKSLQTE